MIPVIISGGSGSRLWPVSRETSPKPFLKLADGFSLLQNTFIRAANLTQVTTILTVTNEKLHFRMQDEYQQLINSEKFTNNTPTCDFILEPFGRNTAAATINACLFVSTNHPDDEIVLILPADHLISDTNAFTQAVDRAMQLAKQNYIVTFGIKPEYAETGYGYIEADTTKLLNNSNENDRKNVARNDAENAYLVKKFVEKPDLITAEKYLSSGNYLWNSGMFCAKASTLLKEFATYAKELLELTTISFKQAQLDKFKNSHIMHLAQQSFMPVPNISIDYALCEKSQQMAVLPCHLKWSDIGSWLSIAQTLPQDVNHNALIGESILHNTHDCLIYSTDRIVAGVDIDNLIIVDTPDAVLVANKNSAQNVKIIFERLKTMAHQTSELHQTVHRPWGTYTVLEEAQLYKIKRIEVKPGGTLSLQLHHHRSEHWIVVSGIATVTNGEQVFTLSANQSTYIQAKTKHRLENKTADSLVLIEVQCGSYLGEDDIVRFDDIYGR